MQNLTAAAEYVNSNFSNAPSEWLVAEITKTAAALAVPGALSTGWKRDLIAAYTELLVERAPKI